MPLRHGDQCIATRLPGRRGDKQTLLVSAVAGSAVLRHFRLDAFDMGAWSAKPFWIFGRAVKNAAGFEQFPATVHRFRFRPLKNGSYLLLRYVVVGLRRLNGLIEDLGLIDTRDLN
jgi:hypothetical protein